MFYKVDSTKITLKEYAFEVPAVFRPILLPILALLRMLRVRLPASTDDPCIDSTAPFEVPLENFPVDVAQKFQPIVSELNALGFHSPVCHVILDTAHSTRTYWATFLHESGRAFARIHDRIWTATTQPKPHFFTTFFTAFENGTFAATTSGKPDMLWPESCRINRIVDATPAALWAAHQQALSHQWAGAAIQPVTTQAELLAAIERHHALVRDFHVNRGVFRPMTPVEAAATEDVKQSLTAAESSGLPHADVLAAMDQIHKKKTDWGSTILLLAISLGLFLGAGGAAWSWEFTLLLIPILLFHELGHLAAMKFFNYRNLRMFFLPLMGAAAMGRNYNVAGWKKAVVSLMGPLPGIFLGAVVGIYGMVWDSDAALKAALVLLVLNGLNLLPLIPFDGGWTMHSILFSRHHLLDTAFRGVAAVILLCLAAILHDRLLFFIGIITAVALPASYRLALAAANLRAKRLDTTSPDDHTIPRETAVAIIDELKNSTKARLSTKMIAQQTIQVFESLNARPPNVLASLGLLAAYGGGIFAAILFSAVFFLARQGDIGEMIETAETMPQQRLNLATLKSSSGTAASVVPADNNTFITTFAGSADAERHYENLAAELPDTGRIQLLGGTVMLSLPVEEALKPEWLAKFEAINPNVFVDSKAGRSILRMVCVAPNFDTATSIEQELDRYNEVGSEVYGIPPWHPNDTRSAPEKYAHDKAQDTFIKLVGAEYSEDYAQSWRKHNEAVEKARRVGDAAKVKELTDAFTKTLEANRRAAQEGLKSQPNMDAEVVAGYFNLKGEEYSSEWYKQVRETIGSRFGQLPLEDGKVKAGEDRYSAHYSSVSKNGLILTFYGVSFYQIIDGAPAFLQWLKDKGCVDFRYEIRQGTRSDDYDPHSEEDEY